MFKTIKNCVFIFFLFIGVNAFASGGEIPYSTPIQIGVFPPVQFPTEKFDVHGIRLSLLMGSNRSMHGIDLGLIGSRTKEEFIGAGVAGVFNWNQGKMTVIGAQIAGITNINESSGKVYGLQAALVANLSAYTDIYGAQIGLYNKARDVYGLQLGLVNVAANLHGVQIGLANFNDGGRFRVSPLINFGF